MTASAPPGDNAGATPKLLGTWDSVLETADRSFGGRMFDVGELLRLTGKPPSKLAAAIRQLAKLGFIESYGYMVQVTSEGHATAEGIRRHLTQLKKATDELYSAMHRGTSAIVIGGSHGVRIGVMRLAAAEANPIASFRVHAASTMTAQLSKPKLPAALAFSGVRNVAPLNVVRMRNAGWTAFILEGDSTPRMLELHARVLPEWRLIDLDGKIEPAMYRKPAGY
jgi:hypothetical protein